MSFFTPASRSEFSDLVGMLEIVGLVSSSSAGSAASSPSKTGCRALGRAASFGVVKAAVAGQDIKLTETIRADEVIRGLGVTDGLLMAIYVKRRSGLYGLRSMDALHASQKRSWR
jgi:cell division control protein 6